MRNLVWSTCGHRCVKHQFRRNSRVGSGSWLQDTRSFEEVGRSVPSVWLDVEVKAPVEIPFSKYKGIRALVSKLSCTLVTWELQTCNAHPTPSYLRVSLLGVKVGVHRRCSEMPRCRWCCKARASLGICSSALSSFIVYTVSDFTISKGLMSLSLKTVIFLIQIRVLHFLRVCTVCFGFWLCCLMWLWSLNFTTDPIFYMFILFLALITDIYLRALKPFGFKAQNKVIFIDIY